MLSSMETSSATVMRIVGTVETFALSSIKERFTARNARFNSEVRSAVSVPV